MKIKMTGSLYCKRRYSLFSILLMGQKMYCCLVDIEDETVAELKMFMEKDVQIGRSRRI